MDIEYIKNLWKVIPFDKFYKIEKEGQKDVYVFSVFKSHLLNFKQVKTASNFFKITECYITKNICVGLVIELYSSTNSKFRISDSTLSVSTKNAKIDEFTRMEQLYTVSLYNSFLVELLSVKGAELLTILPFKMNVSVL